MNISLQRSEQVQLTIHNHTDALQAMQVKYTLELEIKWQADLCSAQSLFM